MDFGKGSKGRRYLRRSGGLVKGLKVFFGFRGGLGWVMVLAK
jgi:hypothetical protein